MDCSTPDLPVHHQLPELLKLMSIESIMTSNHLILCLPLLFPPAIFPSIKVFSNESALLIRSPVLEFLLQHQFFQWIFRTISFRMDWLDLLVVQGTLKSLLQHHGSKASILQCSILGFLYSPTLTSTHDYWKNNSFDLDGPLLAK